MRTARKYLHTCLLRKRVFGLRCQRINSSSSGVEITVVIALLSLAIAPFSLAITCLLPAIVLSSVSIAADYVHKAFYQYSAATMMRCICWVGGSRWVSNLPVI